MALKTDCFNAYWLFDGDRQVPKELIDLLSRAVSITAVSLNNDTLAITYRDDSTDLPLNVKVFAFSHERRKIDLSQKKSFVDYGKLQFAVRAWQEVVQPMAIPFQVMNDSFMLVFYR